MSQPRKNVQDAQAPALIPDDQILDGAHALLLDVGVRRMGMVDIARRAGVSRATLYRRFANVDAVLAELLAREFELLDDRAFRRPAKTARATVVNAIVTSVRETRANPVFRKILEVDPDYLLPYLLDDRAASTEAQLERLAGALRDNDGTIRGGNRAALARALWLVASAFVLSAPMLADDTVTLETLDRQLRAMLDRFLAP